MEPDLEQEIIQQFDKWNQALITGDPRVVASGSETDNDIQDDRMDSSLRCGDHCYFPRIHIPVSESDLGGYLQESRRQTAGA